MGSRGLTIPQMLQERNLSSAHASPLGRTAAGQSSSVTMRPTSPSTAQAATTSSSVLSRFGPLYMGSQQSYTQAEAVAYAQEFTLIAQRSGEFTPYLAAMKAANPALRVVAY